MLRCARVVGGAAIIVPEAERRWFTESAAYWNDPAYRWHLYHYHERLVLPESLQVGKTLRDGDAFAFGPARITALATPGHTDGGMSYLVEVDGKCIAFTGDLIYDAGQIWELYSLQQGFGNIWGYHGYLGGKDALIASLRRVLAHQPAALVPSHGNVMPDPPAAVDLLADRLRECYAQYLSVNTIRAYFPNDFPSPPGALPVRQALPIPPNLRHLGTTWVLISQSGAAFVMDCGHPSVISDLQRWLASGEITAVEGLWITHYHDDHLDAVAEFQQAFDCPLIADASVADVIAEPTAWRLPALSPFVARVDRRTADGEHWAWREFTFTAYHFPGQSLHHGGLLVESADGPRMFFVGDSFALAGLDDYCMLNRNFLGSGVGYDCCLALLQACNPDLLFNPHVDGAFTFTPEEYQRMRDNLSQRESLYAPLLPWDHPNFAMDEYWAHCFPYEQSALPGAHARFEVVITNHAPAESAVEIHPHFPPAWQITHPPLHARIPAKAVIRLPCELAIPADAAPGRHPVTVDITLNARTLPGFAETILVITE